MSRPRSLIVFSFKLLKFIRILTGQSSAFGEFQESFDHLDPFLVRSFLNVFNFLGCEFCQVIYVLKDLLDSQSNLWRRILLCFFIERKYFNCRFLNYLRYCLILVIISSAFCQWTCSINNNFIAIILLGYRFMRFKIWLNMFLF